MTAATATSLATRTNPYTVAKSFYAAWRDNKLIALPDQRRTISPRAATVHNEFRQFVGDKDFSCIGAKSAVNTNSYRFGFYAEMNSPETNLSLAHDLWKYAAEKATFGANFASFIATFARADAADERAWETALWAQLQSLHELDRKHYAWDSSVSSDPENAAFSFSFAETAFFVVGLHPASSRIARRFAHPTLVFNFHSQFERLRQENRFDRMRQMIRQRDLKLQGSLNPNLSDHGEQSEARQYSGRAVEKEWRCPFRAMVEKTKSLLGGENAAIAGTVKL